MKKNILHTGKTLSYESEIKIRFCEVDSMGIVWHGNYVKYLEDGREAFGRKFNLSYMEIYKKYGYMTPIVKIEINYKKQLFYEDEIIIKTTFTDTPAAKICYEYEIKRKSDNETILTASSTQVFMNKNRELELVTPKFFKKWKTRYL